MKDDALELLMAAYQQAGDAQKTLDAATRVLQADPNNVRALALLAYNYRACRLAGWAADAGQPGQGQAVRPAGLAGSCRTCRSLPA